jgi:hypothetical protein
MLKGLLMAGTVSLMGLSGLEPPKGAQAVKPAGVAVVELFTSEGCNSCPPADALLARLESEQKEGERRVIPLAFHVDYWDYLGWRDRFASKAFSDRQREYAAAFARAGGKGGVYTPQMVVNGTVGFVGSDERAARSAIERALQSSPAFRVAASIAERGPGEPIHIAATIEPVEKPAKDGRVDRAKVLAAAVVEDGLSTDVKRGENAGRTLRHERVVRAFGSKKVEGGKAEVELRLPEGVREDHCRVVVYVQDAEALAVGGAAEMALPEAKKLRKQPTTEAPAGALPTQRPNPAQK